MIEKAKVPRWIHQIGDVEIYVLHKVILESRESTRGDHFLLSLAPAWVTLGSDGERKGQGPMSRRSALEEALRIAKTFSAVMSAANIKTGVEMEISLYLSESSRIQISLADFLKECARLLSLGFV